MFRRWIHSGGLLAVLTAFALTACTEAPERTLAPQTDVPAVTVDAEVAPLLGLRPRSFGEYTLIREPRLAGVLRLTRLIGPEGGLLEVGRHLLSVPAGAVNGPALFSIIALPTGYVEVELLALVPSLLGRTRDIGSRGFRKPVELTLSYSRATNVDDPDRLLILRVSPFGRHEALPSTVDKGARTVTAKLDHFSRYCMASN